MSRTAIGPRPLAVHHSSHNGLRCICSGWGRRNQLGAIAAETDGSWQCPRQKSALHSDLCELHFELALEDLEERELNAPALSSV